MNPKVGTQFVYDGNLYEVILSSSIQIMANRLPVSKHNTVVAITTPETYRTLVNRGEIREKHKVQITMTRKEVKYV